MNASILLRALRIAVFPALFVALAVASCRPIEAPDAAPPSMLYAPASEPAGDAVFTATNEIRALDFDGKTVWAATAGGVLRWQNGALTKWTRRDGLPSNEAFDLERENGELSARFPTSSARWNGEKWQSQDAPAWKRREPAAQWQRKTVTANLDELRIGAEKFALPAQASGTHISALLPRGNVLLVATYGDGLWRFDGKNWSRGPQIPDEAREITALAGDDETLLIGTRRNGIFQRAGEIWQSIAVADDEPFGHNVQFLAQFGGVLWASTLDDGLIARTGKGWRHVAPPQISSSAPRQMLNWQDKLYVRHGNGIVDAFDGASWEKNALKSIPRRGVYALAGDANRLLAAGWGGWSEWDGKTWTPHYDLPSLKGVPIMNMALQNDDVWIGTQSRGIAKWTRATNELKFFDERDGLGDDWITALCVDGPRVWAGTFVGGLYLYQNSQWRALDATKGENVTAIVPDESVGQSGGVWAATRRGLYRGRGETVAKISENWLDAEGQALCADAHGLWIGARTSLNYFRFAAETENPADSNGAALPPQ